MSIVFDFFRGVLLRSKKYSLLPRISKIVSFLFCFLKKIIWEKCRFFLEKPWTNPFAKCRFFGLFQNFTLISGLKSIVFFSKYQKTFFPGFLYLKKNMKKGSIFWKKRGLTLLKNLDFLDCFETSLLRSKKCSLLFRISKNVSFWVSLLKKNILEKGRFFYKNHGLTPLQNVTFQV